MANITLLGASYTDVPAVDLPQTGGGTVRFYENGGGGTSFSKLSSFQIQNGRTGTVTVVRLVYNETTMIGAYNSNVTKSSTATYTDMLTDGSHVWFRLSQGTTLKYNGSNADYVKDGQYFKVTLPSGYDGTIPFVFT